MGGGEELGELERGVDSMEFVSSKVGVGRFKRGSEEGFKDGEEEEGFKKSPINTSSLLKDMVVDN